MNLNKLFLALFLNCLYTCVSSQSLTPSAPDVLSYQVYLDPNFDKQQIEGNLTIHFKIPTKTDKVAFDAGNLTVTKLTGENIKGIEQIGKRLIVSLAKNDASTYNIQVFYEGKPKRGLIFSTHRKELYTVYFTSEWLIFNAAPNDKATLKLEVLVPNHLTTIASGILVDTISQQGQKTLYSWY